jgi:4-hydroxybenzoate polyprenyltransferase
LANACLVGHIFVLNDWSGLRTDAADPDKAPTVFTARGLKPRDVGAMAMVLLGGAVLLLGGLGVWPLAMGLAIAALSALYSLPVAGLHWKARPVASTLAHLLGGACHFLLGSAVAGRVDGRAVAVASFFGLTFAAGHLTQEVRDYRGDLLNAIRTHAVRFGPRAVFAAGLGLFALAYAALLGLALGGVVPRVLAAVVALSPLHLRLALRAYRAGLTYAAVRRLQTGYRLIYVAIGIAMGLAFLG